MTKAQSEALARLPESCRVVGLYEDQLIIRVKTGGLYRVKQDGSIVVAGVKAARSVAA